MATPTLAQVRAVVLAWWREPGRPRIDVLRARIAAIWTDPLSSVRIAVETRAGVRTLVATLERRNPDGTIANTIERTWTPGTERVEDLDDVQDDAGSTPRERTVLP